jgi:hypothetical protein
MVRLPADVVRTIVITAVEPMLHEIRVFPVTLAHCLLSMGVSLFSSHMQRYKRFPKNGPRQRPFIAKLSIGGE